ncbi:MAG: hypothetical protein H6581_14040 [Bacteroidia bacterium]|nr:hypothetical protein [Bacteroidia bacterium]
MEIKNRKQQLEQLGLGLVVGWQDRMVLSQSFSFASDSLLIHSMPQLREWLQDLWKLRSDWTGMVDDARDGFGDLMPWHWLGMGFGGNDHSAKPENQLQSRVNSYRPILHSPNQPIAKNQQFPQVNPANSGEKFVAQPLPERPKKDFPTPVSGNSSEINPCQEEDWDKSNTQTEISPEAADKPIVFRKLDEFAAFLNHPGKSEEKTGLGNEKPNSDSNQRQSGISPSQNPEFKANRKLPFQDFSAADQGSNLPEAELKQLSEKPIQPDLSWINSPSNPEKSFSREIPSAKLEGHTSAEDFEPRELNYHQKSPAPAALPWTQVMKNWEEENQFSPEGRTAEKEKSRNFPQISPKSSISAVQAPPQTREAKPNSWESLPRIQPEKALEVVQVDNYQTSKRPFHQTSSPAKPASEFLPQEFSSTEKSRVEKVENRLEKRENQVHSRAGKTNQIPLEEIMDELTDQLKRDFKRYYGG